MAEEALKTAKTDRRTAKGSLTRCGKSLAKLIEAKRPEQEVRDGLSKLQLAFDNLVAKHENYSRLIEDDTEFEVQEGWMGECQEDFMSMEMDAKIYLDSFFSKEKAPMKTNHTSTTLLNFLSCLNKCCCCCCCCPIGQIHALNSLPSVSTNV